MKRLFNAFCIIAATIRNTGTYAIPNNDIVQNKITLDHENAMATIQCGPGEKWMNFLGQYLSDSVDELTPENICAVTQDGQQPGETGNILWEKVPVLLTQVPADDVENDDEIAKHKALAESMLQRRLDWMNHRINNVIEEADAASIPGPKH